MFQTTLKNIVMRLVLFLFLAGFLAVPAPVQAGGLILVNTYDDEFGTNPSKGCSLREAIFSANYDTAFGGCTAGAGVDTIKVPAGIYILSRADLANSIDDSNETADQIGSIGDLDIITEMAIIGAGPSNTVITGLLGDPVKPDRTINTRIIEVKMRDLSMKPVSLSNLKISYGSAQGTLTDTGDLNGVGGGICNTRSALTLYNVVVEKNKATHSGGGIYNASSPLAALYIYDSKISGNTTTGNPDNPTTDLGRGGGIMNKRKLIIQNSLISGNTAFGNGGGLLTEAGSINFKPNARLVNVTFTGNTTGAGKRGAAIYLINPIEVINSTIAYNPVKDGGAAVEIPAGAVSVSVIVNTIITNNRIDGTGPLANCIIGAGSDPLGTNNLQDPYVSDLLSCKGFNSSDSINLAPEVELGQNQGIHTEGYALKDGSAAIDGGASSYYNSATNTTYYCPGSDYRWAVRPMKGKAGAGGCDIGAYEANDYVTLLPVFRSIVLPILFR